MFKNLRYAHILPLVILLLALKAGAQNKSANIQTIDGKKYYIHKIEKSQSLYAISKLYSVSLDEIYSLNPELRNGAKANQEIKIPAYNLSANQPTVTSALLNPVIDTTKFLIHKVQKGETVYSIARQYNSNEKQLGTYNPNLSQGIKEGQVLIVGEKTTRKKQSAAITQKDKEPKENKNQVIAKEVKAVVPSVDSSMFRPVSKPRKAIYNVALILPLRLDATINTDLQELIKSNGSFPVVPGLAIDFYLGFKKAMDSLATKDYSINLEIFDIDDKDSAKVVALSESANFKELDFIFGPFYANGFKTIAKKAKELHIPIVSPITQQNKILYNNIYISKTNPSQFTLLENLVDYCIDSLKKNNANIILMLLSDKDKKEMQFVNAFKKYYNERIGKMPGKSIKDSLTMARGIAGLKSVMSPTAESVIVMLSNNQVFAIDFITQLSLLAEKKSVVLCGWESLSAMDNIDQQYLNQLNFTFPFQFNLTNTAAYRPLFDYYKTHQEAVPEEYFFRGFDIAWYYLGNLKDKGPDFVHSLNTLPLEAGYTNFKFTRPDNATGFDNRGVYIFRYSNYHLIKTGWK